MFSHALKNASSNFNSFFGIYDISILCFVDFMFYKLVNEIGNGRIESYDKAQRKTTWKLSFSQACRCINLPSMELRNHSLKFKKLGIYIYMRHAHSEASLSKKFLVLGVKRGTILFDFCSSIPFCKFASQSKGQVKVIKREQQ